MDNIADYKRTWYSETGNLSYYSENLPKDEKTSVEKKGFYIGRYETGDKDSTESKEIRTSEATASNTTVVKAGQAPYNWILRAQAQSFWQQDFAQNKITQM